MKDNRNKLSLLNVRIVRH